MSDNHDSSTTLTSLVLLKQQIDGGNDYYNYLVPFIQQIYIEKPDDAFDVNEIQGFMESDFGLIIPKEVVRLVLRRMKRKDSLREESSKFSKGKRFKGKDFRTDQENASNQINEVIESLKKFATELGCNNLSSKQAMEAIQRFLSEFQVECIATFIQGTALPNLSQKEHRDEGLVGLFVINLVEYDYALFKKFMLLVQGNMLANALFSTDTSTPPDTFQKTVFYFDTPNLLGALGYSGDDKEALAKEMISLLKNLHGGIAVFEHSIQEAIKIINTAANSIDDLRYPPRLLNIVARQKGWQRSDLIIRAEKIETDLEDIGFKIKPTPRYNKNFQIDEKKLKHLLFEKNVNYKEGQEDALKNDIFSVRSIYCLRQYNLPRRLEDNNAILVTSNSGFAHAADEYAHEHDRRAGHSTVINDFTLTNIAWLKAPDFAHNLIDAQMIALAYSAMKIPLGDLEAFLENAKSLVQDGKESHDDLQLLRSSTNLIPELASFKVAGKDLEDEQTISSVIRKIRSTYSAETDEAKSALQIEQEAHRQTQKDLREFLNKQNVRIGKQAKHCKIFSYVLSGLICIGGLSAAGFWVWHKFGDPTGIFAIFCYGADIIISIYFLMSIFGLVPQIKFVPIQEFLHDLCEKYWLEKPYPIEEHSVTDTHPNQ